MKKLVCIYIISLLLLPIFSQDASVLTQILKKETATYLDFSYLIASDLGLEGSPFTAYNYCDRFGNFSFTETAYKPVSVKTVSHFLMSNYNLKGGIMWSAFRSPRYAFKELKNTGFWDPGTDPQSTLSGRDLVRAISRFIALYPNARLGNPPTPEASPEQRNALLAEKEITK